MQSKRRKQSWKLTTIEFMFVHFMSGQTKISKLLPHNLSNQKILLLGEVCRSRHFLAICANNRLLFLTRRENHHLDDLQDLRENMDL